jgi:hypothetical protein
MPHGGYHGTVKIGNTTVQQSSRPDGKGGQTGGGQYRAEGYNTSKPQRRILKNKNDIEDNRSRYIANQAQKAENQRAQFLINQERRRNDMAQAFKNAPGTVNKSDFTGYTGGLFGLRTGNYQDTNIPKLREGLTSDEYSKYMSGLYNANPSLMEKIFPFASGKTMRNVSRFMPGLGTLQTIAGNVFGGTKSFIGDKLSGIMNTDVGRDLAAAPSGFLNDLQTMLGMNKSKKEGATTATETKVLDAYQDGSITPGRIEQMAPGVVDNMDIFEGKSIDPTRQIMDMETLVKKAEGSGLASLIENNKINPVRKEKPPMPKSKPMSAYEQAVAEYMNTYGPGSDLFQKEGDFFDEYKGFSYDQLSPSDREYIQRIIQISGQGPSYGGGVLNEMPQNILKRFGTDGGTDYGMFQDSPFRTDNIPAEAFSGARSSLIPQAASIIPQAFKGGGSPENYDVLKSINDTMHG